MEMNNEDIVMDSMSDSSDWSTSDDSDIDELLQDDDVEMMSLLIDVQSFEDRVKLMDQRRGSKMGRVTIYRNRALGHEHLMEDYFAEVPTEGCSRACDKNSGHGRRVPSDLPGAQDVALGGMEQGSDGRYWTAGACQRCRQGHGRRQDGWGIKDHWGGFEPYKIRTRDQQIEAISIELPLDKYDLNTFFPKAWCDQHGDRVINDAHKEFEGHVEEIGKQRQEDIVGGDQGWAAAFEDNFNLRPPPSHGQMPRERIKSRKAFTVSISPIPSMMTRTTSHSGAISSTDVLYYLAYLCCTYDGSIVILDLGCVCVLRCDTVFG